MADLVQASDEGVRTRVISRGTAAAGATGAQSFDLSKARHFRIVKGDNGQTYTFTNVPVPVSPGDLVTRFTLAIVQDSTGSRTKPTLAATDVNGAAVAIKIGTGFTAAGAAGVGATGPVLPVLSTAAGSVDVFEFVSYDGATITTLVQQLAV